MTVSGISTTPAMVIVPRQEREVNAHDGASAPPSPSAPALAAPVRAPARGPQSAIPVAAPPGTDPELWSVLTSAEREFFARSATQGPLTYTKVATSQRTAANHAATARGGRVDVRV